MKQPDFLATNPAGSLPFFVDGEVKMTESVAICLYLVELYGPTVLAVAPAEAGFADYLQVCFYGEATLTQPLGSILRYRHPEPPERRWPQIVDDARALFQRRLKPVKAAVEQTGFAAAGRFTVADISLGYALAFAAGWVAEGAVRVHQTVEHGIENAPAAFLKLFSGGNFGKMLVRLSL